MDTEFHKAHEDLTEIIYTTPGMLPSRYVFVITNRCNLNCDFCFQDKKPKKDAMTAEDWINVAKQLPDYARVTITGGEPLIYPEFEKVFSYVAERFNCNLITNGLLLNEKKIDYLLSYPKFRVLSISIDDIGNKVRGVKEKQWEHLEKILTYFTDKKNESNSSAILDVKTMILDGNAENLFDIYKYLKEKIKVDTHAFQFLKGSPIQHSDCMFELEKISEESNAYVYNKFEIIEKELEKVREYNIKKGLQSFLHPKVASLSSNELLGNLESLNEEKHNPKIYQNCKFPWSSMHINPDGRVFPCLAISLGDIRKNSLIEIINGQESNRFREIIKREGTVEACNRCGWLRLNGEK